MSNIDKQKILIVEDDKNTQLLFAYFLKGLYDLYFAESVTAAKAELEIHEINLILLDLSLIGDEDGLELALFLRKDPKWKDVPIVATTAHAGSGDRDNCLEAGCNDYLSKPIKQRDMLGMINKFLHN